MSLKCVRPNCRGTAEFEATNDPEYPVRIVCTLCYLQTSEYVSKARAWASWFQRDKDDYHEQNIKEST